MGENIDKKKQQYKIIAIVVVVLLLIFGIGHHIRKNGGLFVPKTVSLKSSGQRVWLWSEGLQKDACIDYIFVVKNGKFIQYQVFDDNITLGKASKMSDSQLISLGKKQDRKYFDKSADEVKALRDGKRQIGLQDDLMQYKELKDTLDVGSSLYFKYDKYNKKNGNYSNPKLISKSQYDDIYEQEGRDHNTIGTNEGLMMDDQIVNNSVINTRLSEGDQLRKDEKVNDLRHVLRRRRINMLLDNMKNVKYLPPKWQKVSLKSKTDPSGNEIVGQKLYYKNVDEFNDADVMDNNVINNLSATKKQQIANLLAGDNSSVKEKLSQYNSVFDDSYYKQVTKNVFKPHLIDMDDYLAGIVHQQIYDSKYIGYLVDGDNYLVTKAQNNKQHVVFAK